MQLKGVYQRTKNISLEDLYTQTIAYSLAHSLRSGTLLFSQARSLTLLFIKSFSYKELQRAKKNYSYPIYDKWNNILHYSQTEKQKTVANKDKWEKDAVTKYSRIKFQRSYL